MTDLQALTSSTGMFTMKTELSSVIKRAMSLSSIPESLRKAMKSTCIRAFADRAISQGAERCLQSLIRICLRSKKLRR